MNMTPENYKKYVQELSPQSPVLRDCANAFLFGGLICAFGQIIIEGWSALGLSNDMAATASAMTLVFLSVLLTGFSFYDNIAKIAGAGTLVPITGFANSIAAPAIEFRSEGIITGTCVKLFSIAGPVLVFGICSSVLYGILYWIACHI